ncbi:MAG TPA: DUF2630 family protein [Chloroflexota bacterium]|jgi:hypothetical protein|nr:DUF2630 family protein [Chloroflexota bacterium]
MDDRDVMQRVNELDAEEHRLLERGEAKMGLDQAERARLHELHVELDRLWDLIRQRRARRHAGLDPEGAKLRSASVVEQYRQ